jgi:hypothetical protein
MTYRNKKLLEACRELPCQICYAQDGTVCACHSNQQVHGKGTGIKASDAMVASLCAKCHYEIDNGKKYGKEERREQWNRAHQNTMIALIESERLVVK